MKITFHCQVLSVTRMGKQNMMVLVINAYNLDINKIHEKNYSILISLREMQFSDNSCRRGLTQCKEVTKQT